MCKTSKQVNTQQQDNETCCSTMIAAAAGPTLALGEDIAANVSTERYVPIVQDLYKANMLPCPDMQLLIQYSDLNASGGGYSNYQDPYIWVDARSTTNGRTSFLGG